MIELSHIYKTYSQNVSALKNITLSIEKGEFVYLTGPSGAGKTTLFKIISAFDKPSSGYADVAGYNLGDIKNNQIPYLRRNIGVVYQDYKLLNNRTVYENVILPLEVRGEPDSYCQRRASEILEQVGLLHKKNSFPQQLSGGEQQRVSIARAIIHYPSLLIADEPTGNLDPSLSEEIMDLFEKVNAQGTTVFIATHNHELVKRRAKRIIKLAAGEMTEES